MDWNTHGHNAKVRCNLSLPTRECGLKYSETADIEEKEGHSLRGSVDWNEVTKAEEAILLVTPYAGVWIEIIYSFCDFPAVESLPTRECGLKFAVILGAIRKASHSLRGSVDWNICVICCIVLITVTPYAGVWIEIWERTGKLDDDSVTPYAGVWIEICCDPWSYQKGKSLPTRECGLKSYRFRYVFTEFWSLPTRECGLKSEFTVLVVSPSPSLPTRECGLKYHITWWRSS